MPKHFKEMRINLYLLTSCLVFALSCKKQTVNPSETDKPNIIYILADDLGYGELGVYGQTKIETPNIDALANNGLLFTQHYSGAAVCAPARSVLMTGQHMGHTYIRGNDEWNSRGEKGDVWNYVKMIRDSTLEGQRPLPKTTRILPQHMKSAGYRTGMIGKWGLGAPHTSSIPTEMGFDYFFGYNCQRQAHTLTPVHLYENERRFYLKNDTIAPGTKLLPEEDPYNSNSYTKYMQPDYAPEVSFQKLMSFLERDDNRPFFLYWATPIPHVPLQAPERWIQYYNEKFGDEEPYTGDKGYFPTRYPRASYAAMISYLDENIGKLVAHLKKTGQFNNTLIIFTSDNGPSYAGGTDSSWFNSGGPFESTYGRGKGFLYEGGIRVPMIASWPDKIEAGKQTDHISAFWDVLPTLCDITGITSPENTDGISFANTLFGKKTQQSHEYLYWEFPEYGGQVAVRMGKWKLLWKDLRKGNTNIELYNLDEDPAELNDVSVDHPNIVSMLKTIIQKEHTTPETERFVIPALEAIME